MRATENGAWRIVLVTGLQSVHKLVAEALDQTALSCQLHWVAEAELGIERAVNVGPHLVLLNDDTPGEALLSLVKGLALNVPDAAVVVMVEHENVTLASRAVLAGARGFALKPLNALELAPTLQQVLTQPSQREARGEKLHNGQVIAFCSPKGGTGRTTLAINTAIALHQSTEKSLALVDADYAAPALDVALNLHPARDMAELLARASEMDEELAQWMLTEHSSGIKVLIAPPPGASDEPISLPDVQRIVSTLSRMFAYTLVDLGLPFDEPAYAYLDMADRVVISVLPEMVGLRNARLLLDQLAARGYPPEKIMVVLNRFSMAGAVPKDDIETRLHTNIAYCIPDDQPLATYSVNRGVPIMLSHKHGALVRGYEGFARRLASELTPVDEADDEQNRGVEKPRRRPGLMAAIARSKA